VTYHARTGWHFHVHLLALRAVWWAQADLAQAWQQATAGAGLVVDIRAVKPEERPLIEGQGCPDCGLPLTARWLSREALYGEDASSLNDQDSVRLIQ
jgi:hypothetical protein